METKQPEKMKRGDFLRSLGMSSAALMAFYCIGTTMTSCSKGSDDPEPDPGTSGKVDFTLDLNSTDFSKLKTEGGYVIKDNVIVAKVKGGAFAALSKTCTHQGGTLEYVLSESAFYCPNHGSRFSPNGAVLNDPATQPVKVYKTELSANGNSLRVFES